MGAIYRLATHTCIWLGQEADDSDLAMELIGLLNASNFDSLSNTINFEGRLAIAKLQKRAWWSRVWVIQGL